jgi:hypothetical protein
MFYLRPNPKYCQFLLKEEVADIQQIASVATSKGKPVRFVAWWILDEIQHAVESQSSLEDLVFPLHANNLVSLRDLRRQHLKLLKMLRRAGTSLLSRCGFAPENMHIFVHYPCILRYALLHVHFQGGGELAKDHRAHFLEDIIMQVEERGCYEGTNDHPLLEYEDENDQDHDELLLPPDGQPRFTLSAPRRQNVHDAGREDFGHRWSRMLSTSSLFGARQSRPIAPAFSQCIDQDPQVGFSQEKDCRRQQSRVSKEGPRNAIQKARTERQKAKRMAQRASMSSTKAEAVQQRTKWHKTMPARGGEIVGMSDGASWGVVTGDLGRVWRLSSGRIAKKSTEGKTWRWADQC